MPNLRGASPVGRGEGGHSYVARAVGRGEIRVGEVVVAESSDQRREAL